MRSPQTRFLSAFLCPDGAVRIFRSLIGRRLLCARRRVRQGFAFVSGVASLRASGPVWAFRNAAAARKAQIANWVILSLFFRRRR